MSPDFSDEERQLSEPFLSVSDTDRTRRWDQVPTAHASMRRPMLSIMSGAGAVAVIAVVGLTIHARAPGTGQSKKPPILSVSPSQTPPEHPTPALTASPIPAGTFDLTFSGQITGTTTYALPTAGTWCKVSQYNEVQFELPLPNGDRGLLSLKNVHVGAQPVGSSSTEATAYFEEDSSSASGTILATFTSADNPNPSGTLTINADAKSGSVSVHLFATNGNEVTVAGPFHC